MKKYIQLLMILLFVVVCSFAFYFYLQWQKAIQVIKENPVDEIATITEIISQSMDLPEGETPTLATVNDKEKLKDQQFFTKAENGDKVLVYNKSSKAILYRPSTKRVIEVAPIYVDDTSSLSTSSGTTTPKIDDQQTKTTTTTVRLAFYNGSGVAEKNIPLAEKIKTEFLNAETVIVSNTSGVYTGILVVDVNGKLNTEAASIANLLEGRVSVLPPTEPKPDADILIIIGK